jgi:glycosyltransferase involved in cell wall biosynthesis
LFTIGYLYKHEISIKTVSIIITTYKHQDFIANTIESILCQTYVNWELLIGDDSPDDNTWDIIQQYILKYPDKINARHNQPNKGIVENINFLLSQISRESEYIAFLE